MSVLSGGLIRLHKIISPHCERTEYAAPDGTTLSYGQSFCGYDIRVEFDFEGRIEDFYLDPGNFILASTMEQFDMPKKVMGIVHDKSTWARKGLSVYNTVIEPGWKGFLTLELKNNGHEKLHLERGMPIAQVVFHLIDAMPMEQAQGKGYNGKYQNQKRGPQYAR